MNERVPLLRLDPASATSRTATLAFGDPRNQFYYEQVIAPSSLPKDVPRPKAALISIYQQAEQGEATQNRTYISSLLS